MAMKKTHDAVYAGEKYTDRDGNEKTRYVNVGSLLTRDDGSMTLKLEALPVNFSGWINFYEPKERGQGGEQRQRPQRSAARNDDVADDPIPF